MMKITKKTPILKAKAIVYCPVQDVKQLYANMKAYSKEQELKAQQELIEKKIKETEDKHKKLYIEDSTLYTPFKDYKGPRVNITVNGLVFKPYELTINERRSRNTKISIKNNVYAVSFVPSKVMPQYIRNNWIEHDYYSVLERAEDKIAKNPALEFEDAIHKALWEVLFNRPYKLVMYTNKLAEKQRGILEFCLTHGIDIDLYDETTRPTKDYFVSFVNCPYKVLGERKPEKYIRPIPHWIFRAVDNKHMCPLYQGMTYTNADIKKLSQAKRYFKSALDKYENECKEKYYEEIKELRGAYFKENLEGYSERVAFAKLFEARELVMNNNLPYVPLYFEEEIIPQMLKELIPWNGALGFNLSYTAVPETTSDSYYIWQTEWEQQDRIMYAIKDHKETSKTVIRYKCMANIKVGLERVYMPGLPGQEWIVDESKVETQLVSRKVSVHRPMYIKPKYAGRGYKDEQTTLRIKYPKTTIDPRVFAVKKQVQLKYKNLSSTRDVLAAYQNFVYYLENGIENFIDNTYFICEKCGYPVHETAEFCEHCGQVYYPVINVYKDYAVFTPTSDYIGYDPHIEDIIINKISEREE